ncbi:MAG: hypothetical protein AAFV38_11965 [Pseudomonadota bacterium]
MAGGGSTSSQSAAVIGSTVEDILESCARGAGVNSQGITQTAFEDGISYARLNVGNGVAPEIIEAVNACADRNGGNTAVPARQIDEGFPLVATQRIGCPDNVPIIWRGNFTCLKQ